MSSSYDVLEFLDALEHNPGSMADPRVIDALRRKVLDDLGGSAVVLAAPLAPFTYECTATMAKANAESNQASIEFPWPVEVTALIPIIVPAVLPLPGGDVAPTLDDVAISIQSDQEEQWTQGQQTGNTSDNFVTGTTLSILTPRLFRRCLYAPSPKLRIQWRWKQGPGVFTDSICTLAALARKTARNYVRR